MQRTFQPPLSLHALQRSCQRGVSDETIAFTFALADIVVPAGSGCERRILSRLARSEALAEGWPPMLVERAARLTLLVAGDGTIVSMWRHDAGARVRAHRRRGGR